MKVKMKVREEHKGTCANHLQMFVFSNMVYSDFFSWGGRGIFVGL